jgi:hypothetical protein
MLNGIGGRPGLSISIENIPVFSIENFPVDGR